MSRPAEAMPATDPPTIRLLAIGFRELPMRTRFPFRYGIASMTDLPHLILEAEVEVNGTPVRGVAAEGLPPKWFTKNPATTFEADDLPAMRGVIAHAAESATSSGDRARSFFRWWRRLAEDQAAWARSEGIAPLLANLGTSLVERAALDALCRAVGQPFHRVVREGLLGIEPGSIHHELGGNSPGSLVAERPVRHLEVRHTVGLGDPLTAADAAGDDRPDDGLPFTLEENLAEYGIRLLKIKLSGRRDDDHDRLAGIREVIVSARRPRDAPPVRFTVDGNENFATIDGFREQWETHLDDRETGDFLREGLLFVEQPLHRSVALADDVAAALAAWPDHPPLIIDESDAEPDSVPRALALGYAGASHKNCKGIVKGLLNAALVRHHGGIVSAEDLANVGPVALLQDLAVVAALGVPHAERNGHHYFRGLSAFPEPIRRQVLATHGDLYHRHPGGFPTLAIDSGRLDLASVNAAPFGVAPDLDLAEIPRSCP